MTSDFQLVEIANADSALLDQIVSLLNSSFKTQTTLADWHWFTKNCPWGVSRVYGALSESGDLIACYGVSISRLVMKDSLVTVGYGHHLAISPTVRSAAFFHALSRHVMAEETAIGTALVLGAPNSRASGLHRRLAGWVELGTLATVVRKPQTDKRETLLELGLPFTEEFLSVQKAATRSSSWSFARDLDWLNWRYRERPETSYEIVGLRDRNRFTAWAVLKWWNDPRGLVRLHVMEAWARDTASADRVLHEIAMYAGDADEIHAWVNPAIQLYSSFLRAGFSSDPLREQPLLMKSLVSSPLLGDVGPMVLGDADGY
jgi:hypothetical protein